jgi:hypothetical protein
MENITIVALIIIVCFVFFWLTSSSSSDNNAEHMDQTVPLTQSYVPANYQNVGGLNYLKLSDALYAPNMLSSSVLSANVSANTINAGNINADNINSKSVSIGGVSVSDKLASLQSTDSVTSELIDHLEHEHSSLSNLVQNIQSEMNSIKPVYSASGSLSDSNLIQNIKFTNAWSAYPDDKQDGAEISNDVGKYKTLMIVGNKAKSEGKGIRTVGIWDELDVNGQLNVTGGLSGTKSNVFDWIGNGVFRADKQNQLRDQYIMNVPGDTNSMPSIVSRDSQGRGLSINTQGTGNVIVNGRDIIKELDLIKAKINY